MDTDEIARLTAALRAVRAELDATPVPAGSSLPGTAPSPQALRYQKAVREAALALERSRTSFNSDELSALRRALESLLLDARR